MVGIRRLPTTNRDVDMTEGPILRHIIRFALPLLFGNLFQQLYNTVDTWVVGNFVNNEAFSAVGSVAQVINVLVGFFLGLSTGVEVIIANYYGAHDKQKVHDALHTAMVMNLIASALMTVVGLWMIPFMLKFMNTPAEVFPEAKEYLTIYFAGIVGLTTYNIGSGILRAIGDSYHPFCFLALTTGINIALDLLFVIVFHWGVRGVALATILSQGLSAVLIIRLLIKSTSWIRLEIKELKIDYALLKRIVSIGFPAGLQTSVTAFSNVFLHSYVYYFGADCMSGWTAYDKAVQFMHLPMQSVSLAVTTFVSQNLGGGQLDRARKGFRDALFLVIGITGTLMICNEIFAPHIIAFFNDKAAVVRYGTLFLRAISPFYVICGVCLVFAAAIRGFGDSRTPAIVIIMFYVVFRQVFLLISTNCIGHDINYLIAAYNISWILSCIVFVFFYKKMVRGRQGATFEQSV